MNIDKIPQTILEDIAQNMGYIESEELITPYLERMETMTPRQLFDRYCNWHGLIEWGDILFDIVETLQNAK